MRTLPSVLIVDDEPGVRESLRATLSAECAVHTAASGDEALALLHATPVDVVTLDLRMPGLGGMEILARIKDHDPDIEALIISGYGPRQPVSDSCGVFAYLSKPFDVERVRNLVRRAAARRESVRRLRRLRHELLAGLTRVLAPALPHLAGPPSATFACAPDSSPGAEGSSLGNAGTEPALDGVRANEARLLRYLEDLVLLTGLETGEVPVIRDAVHLDPLVVRICERHRPRVSAKGLTIEVEAGRAVVARTDAHLMERLLDALVANAIALTSRGGIVCRVDRTTDGRSATVSVRDSSSGMSQDNAAAALAPWDGEPTDDQSLGLRLVGAIGRRLDAAIRVTGEPGAGTEVRITLPAIAVCSHRADGNAHARGARSGGILA